MARRPRLPAFELRPVPSRCWLTVVMVSVATGTWLVLVYAPAALAALPWAGLYAFCVLRRDGWWRAAPPIRRVTVDSTGRLRIWRDEAIGVEARVEDDSIVLPWIIVLAVRLDGRRRTLVVWPDSAEDAARRQLAVYLRCFLEPA